MQKIKQALKSKTVILAAAQAVLGIVILVLTEAELVGYAMMVKSLADILLRALTTEPLSAK